MKSSEKLKATPSTTEAVGSSISVVAAKRKSSQIPVPIKSQEKRKPTAPISAVEGSGVFKSAVVTKPKPSQLSAKAASTSHSIAKPSQSRSTQIEKDFNLLEDEQDIYKGAIQSEDLPASAKPSNHLPVTVYSKYKGNLNSIAFIGLYGADGLNSRKLPKTGFYFRSTDFPHFHRLLKAVGVLEPQLSFAPNKKSFSPKLRAGYLGSVTWTFHSKEVKEAREELGLPNSVINNTEIPKATNFVFEWSKLELWVFILYWIAGDGCIHYTDIHSKEHGSQLSFNQVSITSRDFDILRIMNDTLEQSEDTTLTLKKESYSSNHEL